MNEKPETDPKQSEAFRRAVRELDEDGKLSPDAAEAVCAKILRPKPTGPKADD